MVLAVGYAWFPLVGSGAVTHTIIQQPQPVVHVVHESSPVMRAAVLRLSKQNAQLSGEVRSLKALVMQVQAEFVLWATGVWYLTAFFDRSGQSC